MLKEPNLDRETIERINDRLPYVFYMLNEMAKTYELDIEEYKEKYGQDSFIVTFDKGRLNSVIDMYHLLLGD